MKPSPDTRPVPRARAELLSSMQRVRADICAAWGVSALVAGTAYVYFVPLREILALPGFGLEALLLLPLLALVLAPSWSQKLGLRHARWVLRRRLSSWMAAIARKHGASLSELEPVVREDVKEFLR